MDFITKGWSNAVLWFFTLMWKYFHIKTIDNEELHNCTTPFNLQDIIHKPKRSDIHLNAIEKGESDL